MKEVGEAVRDRRRGALPPPPPPRALAPLLVFVMVTFAPPIVAAAGRPVNWAGEGALGASAPSRGRRRRSRMARCSKYLSTSWGASRHCVMRLAVPSWCSRRIAARRAGLDDVGWWRSMAVGWMRLVRRDVIGQNSTRVRQWCRRERPPSEDRLLAAREGPRTRL